MSLLSLLSSRPTTQNLPATLAAEYLTTRLGIESDSRDSIRAVTLNAKRADIQLAVNGLPKRFRVG